MDTRLAATGKQAARHHDPSRETPVPGRPAFRPFSWLKGSGHTSDRADGATSRLDGRRSASCELTLRMAHKAWLECVAFSQNFEERLYQNLKVEP
jgi:hypothetical protein